MTVIQINKGHIYVAGNKIPLRAQKTFDSATGVIIEKVSKPHYKGTFIAQANAMLAKGQITRDTFTKIVSGFFK